MKIEESLNVTFDETPPHSKKSPLVDDDLDEEETAKVTKKKNLEKDIEDETLEIDKKKGSNLIIVQIYVDDIIFGSTCQDMCDEFSKIMHDEFEMSMMGELSFFLRFQIEDGTFFNQSKYIKEMLKKFGLEESKPMKTPMSSDTKLTKDEECDSVDSTKYRGMIEGQIFVEFVIQNQLFSFSLEEFGHILGIPYEGDCSFSDKWSLDDLQYSVPTGGPYQTTPPSPDDIKLYVQVEREDTWVDIMRENIFCLSGNRDHVHACLCHMLYCIATSTRYNLAYLISKQMEFVTKQARLILPYGMLLTCLFNHVMSENPELSNALYVLYDRDMYPLVAQQEQKPRKDYATGRGRSSISFSSAFGQPSSSYPNDDDNDGNDEVTLCASTPSLLVLLIRCQMPFLKSFQIHPILTQTWKPFTLVKLKS
nr:pentatricopeptide repeat-containing protein [Tanacetum cinerariifolium]